MRALLLVLAGAGCGAAPDASAYGDEGANTLGHLFQAHPGLDLPQLFSLGLWKSVMGDVFSARSQNTRARWGRLRPSAATHHPTAALWELAGAMPREPFAIFQEVPPDLRQALESETGAPLLVVETGELEATQLAEQLRTGQLLARLGEEGTTLELIAHEAVLPRARLAELCRLCRRHGDRLRLERVLGRSFGGEPRHLIEDAPLLFPLVPPRTVLNAIAESGLRVSAIGPVRDAFAGSGITDYYRAQTLEDTLLLVESLLDEDREGLILARLEADPGAAGPGGLLQVLPKLEADLPYLLGRLEEDDLLILAGDCGSDQTSSGHPTTREEVPLLACYQGRQGPLGTRRTLADVAATLADFFRLGAKWRTGRSFLR